MGGLEGSRLLVFWCLDFDLDLQYSESFGGGVRGRGMESLSLGDGEASEEVFVLMFNSVWGRRRVLRRALSLEEGDAEGNEGESILSRWGSSQRKGFCSAVSVSLTHPLCLFSWPTTRTALYRTVP